jgi:hypothetical protein
MLVENVLHVYEVDGVEIKPPQEEPVFEVCSHWNYRMVVLAIFGPDPSTSPAVEEPIPEPTDIDMMVNLKELYEKLRPNGREYLDGRVLRRCIHAERQLAAEREERRKGRDAITVMGKALGRIARGDTFINGLQQEFYGHGIEIAKEALAEIGTPESAQKRLEAK